MYNDNQRSVYQGKKIRVEIFGASHAPEIGVKIDGLKGERFDGAALQSFLDRRKPKSNAASTPRKEDDKVLFEQGVDGENILGEVVAVIKNSNQKSRDYDKTYMIPRPAHADFVAWSKYGNGFDHRGGGKFSGRLTAPMCIAGGICKQLLEKSGVKINAYISKIGTVQGKGYGDVDLERFDFSALNKDFPTIDEKDAIKMQEQITSARENLDSVGGEIECVITGVPVGSGEYMFDSIESVISHLAFAVPAVKGIAFGSGFDLTSMRGSAANDPFTMDNGRIKTQTNHNGGINGGIANGMPITFKVAIKPTPSIGREQTTVNMQTKEKVKIKIEGRHDSCIVPRAVPVIEAIAAMAIYDIVEGE